MTSGLLCPMFITPIPATKSKKIFPSKSCTIAPSARSMTQGVAQLIEEGISLDLFSITTLDFGPGSSVIIFGRESLNIIKPPYLIIYSYYILYLNKNIYLFHI